MQNRQSSCVTEPDGGIPDAYEPWARSSPFLDLIGPLYSKVGPGDILWFGVRVDGRHVNRRGFAHGGLLATLADMVLGYTVARAAKDHPPFVTTSMSLDIASPARLGDWLEGKAEVQKLGRTTGFANAYLLIGDRRVVRASAVFVTPQRA
jgi:uncharacterized protein (TIGR00369 family)